jgi:hypothetical protein
VPELANHSLLSSIGQLCDAGCDVNFDAQCITMRYQDDMVLTGSRTGASKLWHLHLPLAIEQANSAIGAATPAHLVTFTHAALFSPALLTLD